MLQLYFKSNLLQLAFYYYYFWNKQRIYSYLGFQKGKATTSAVTYSYAYNYMVNLKIHQFALLYDHWAAYCNTRRNQWQRGSLLKTWWTIMSWEKPMLLVSDLIGVSQSHLVVFGAFLTLIESIFSLSCCFHSLIIRNYFPSILLIWVNIKLSSAFCFSDNVFSFMLFFFS